MIIVGGLNVFPAEIENILKQHPQVYEVAAVGVPDQRPRSGDTGICSFGRQRNSHGEGAYFILPAAPGKL